MRHLTDISPRNVQPTATRDGRRVIFGRALPKMLNDWRVGLGLFAFLCHVWTAWVYGATYWYDSFIYATLADSLNSFDGLAKFYSGPRYFLYQHLMPGPSLLWNAAKWCGGSYAWPVFCFIQHGVSCLTTLYFVLSLRPVLPRWAIFLLTGILSTFPLLRCFDNALLTESIFGSMLLLGTGATLRLLLGPAARRDLMLLGIAIFCGTQFRAYFVTLGLGWIVLVGLSLFRRSNLTRTSRTVAFLSGCLATGYLLFPVYRWSAIDEFFLANADVPTTAHAVDCNLNCSPELNDYIHGLDLPKSFDFEAVSNNGLDYLPWMELAATLKDNGATMYEVRRLFRDLAARARCDSFASALNCASLSLTSSGFTRCDWWLAGNHQLRRNVTVKDHLEFVAWYRTWQSWLSPADYRVNFANHCRQALNDDRNPESAATIRDYAQLTEKFISSATPEMRDPLRIAAVPSECWCGFGIAGLALLVFQRRGWEAIVLAMPIPINLIVMFLPACGNPRYSYAVYPTYFVGTVVVVVGILQAVERTRLATHVRERIRSFLQAPAGCP